MLESSLDDAALERIYDALAEALDRSGREHEAVFLAKLALTLAARLGNEAEILDAIAIAERDLDP
ncbi:MAG: DUF2783 domain-containing protein [Alphaproteobacteria bacterium]|nr:MAG: DUF2783 domain-containing protein [Alphaproteobacteria bacterium]